MRDVQTTAESMCRMYWMAGLRPGDRLLNAFPVSGGGSTCWELLYFPVPLMVIVLADNQENIALRLAEAGAAVNCGRAAEIAITDLSGKISELIANSSQRRSLIENGLRLVDGKGAQRVVEAISPTPLSLHSAQWADRGLLFRWANDPEIRKRSFSQKSISWNEHQRWLAGKLRDPNCRLYLIRKISGTPIGQVRFDIEAGEATISVSLAKAYRGLGFGSRAIAMASQAILKEPGISAIRALVKNDNLGSRQAFLNAGFRSDQELEYRGAKAHRLFYGSPHP